MDESEDAKELKRKIAQASRIAFGVTDQTTRGSLLAWIDELKSRLNGQRQERRIKAEITERAKVLWENAGRPDGRDLEFWLKAEEETRGRAAE